MFPRTIEKCKPKNQKIAISKPSLTHGAILLGWNGLLLRFVGESVRALYAKMLRDDQQMQFCWFLPPSSPIRGFVAIEEHLLQMHLQNLATFLNVWGKFCNTQTKSNKFLSRTILMRWKLNLKMQSIQNAIQVVHCLRRVYTRRFNFLTHAFSIFEQEYFYSKRNALRFYLGLAQLALKAHAFSACINCVSQLSYNFSKSN